MNSTPSYVRVQTFCLAVIATAVMIYLVYWLRPVLVPFVVALFVVSGVTPILEGLEKRLGVNRLIAAAITFLLGLALMVVLGICLWLSVLQMAEQGEAYRERVRELMSKAQIEVDQWFDREEGEESVFSDEKLNKTRENIDKQLRAWLTVLSAELFNLMTTSMVVLIYVFFILLGSVEKKDGGGSFAQIDDQVRSYLSLKTLISMITGAIFGFALWLFGVPMALTFGMLAFLLNFIPNVGPIVGTVLPLPFILLSPDGSLGWMVAAILTISTIQLISGNVIEPKIMGSSSNLHPVVILLALMFWGMMWGITGMFLATPITAGLKIAFERFESTRPIAAVFAGHWNALTPQTESTV